MIRLPRYMLSTLAALCLFGVTTTPAHAAPVIGEPAPAFTATDSNGVSHKLSDFAGKTVVLEWTNHDCPFVRKFYNAGAMQKHQQNAADAGIVWLSIVSSAEGKQGYVTPEQANALTGSRDAKPAAVLLDTTGEIGRLYEAKTTPHMFVINPEGVLAYMGAIDSMASADPADIETATNYVTAAIEAVTAGTMPTVTSTAPYGCAVKY